FQTYAWGLYSTFGGFRTGTSSEAGNYTTKHNESECDTDNFNKSQSGEQSKYKYQLKTEPSTDPDYTNAYTFIRRVNIMLQNVDGASMSEVEKEHWKAVGLFFRAFRYYDLITRYGDVIWVDQVIGDSDTELYTAKRTPRDEIAKNMLDDLLWAEAHIKEEGEGNNTVNVHVVRAVISRFGLFEGTWRKYHGLADAELYLNASITASEKLMDSFPSVMSNYDDLYNSEDLPVGVTTGVILARKYSKTVTDAAHSIGRVVRTSAWYYDLTKNAVESYLCTDGKPVGSSTVYEGDENMYLEFRNRDRRLYYTVMPPYKINITGPAGTSMNDDQWEHTGDPLDREYIDMMETITTPERKYLPARNFAGYLTCMSPHFRNFPNGQGFIVSELGYYYWKYYNRYEDDMALRASIQNYPVFRMGEILVNYAEAMFEMGKFDQSVANKTINKLRDRVGIPHLNLAEVDAAFDPVRDQTVDPVLWEIRRERRVELMGDGFRFNDLKRWKKGHYVDEQALGVKVKNSDYDNSLTLLDGAAEGNVVFFGKPAGWLEKYYLEPIPIQEQILNPNLGQNPGWIDYTGSNQN
ncbi:MAG: RagB/SusD family nutrient uptake outer membrane protein, partial [Tannerellaceae bacterium]|nr:RagB/SusD family nutrient uptake outer membrane protein [Tannerellaceae bacterium]